MFSDFCLALPKKSLLVSVGPDVVSAWKYTKNPVSFDKKWSVLTSGGAEGAMPYLCEPDGNECPSDRSEHASNVWGTYGLGQGSIVSIIARKLNANGALLCATQIQAENEHKYRWLSFYEVKSSACRWFCKDGFYGDACSKKYADGDEVPSDDTDYSVYNGYRAQKLQNGINFFGDLNQQQRHSGGTANQVEVQVFGYDDFYMKKSDGQKEDPSVYVLTVVTPGSAPGSTWENPKEITYPNGMLVMVAKWGHASWSTSKIKGKWWAQIWPGSLGYSEPFMLCASGYRLDKNDKYKCVKYVVSEEDKKLKNLCNGFPKDKYKGSAVMELYQDGSCYKYKCVGKGIGFKDLESKNCVSCEAPRSGVMTSGECSPKCDEIEHFDTEQQKCVRNLALSRMELAYGKGANSPKEFSKACWPLVGYEEYYNCVMTGTR